ncbi:uncharacterized protein QC763_202950 [Podospora pseudopauciseta]|uniref:25S rRNA (Uridine(2843)-N(3))-methyltransferase n=1 Tax=Podospora pseudopauciseta TaxID=2093780 RepID=A0ABR0HNE9_9PEZI|nr:hypothetical protein QC763_202950 [Podospora pseudopauciseta]
MVQAKLDTAPQKARSKQTASKPKRRRQTPEQHKLKPNPNNEKVIISPSELTHYQLILDIFTRTFNETLTDADFSKNLQTLKQSLFDRDFATAFTNTPSNLPIYSARWSPPRALAYSSIFTSLSRYLPRLYSPTNTLPCLAIGGCSAELAAFASALTLLPGSPSGSLTLLDSAPWSEVLTNLSTSLTSPPPISKYASKLTVQQPPFIPAEKLTYTFLQQDALTTPFNKLFSSDTPQLVTLFFTLNELFTSSGIGKTTSFLLNLSSAISLGSLLLVVDSPGSYSETTVGTSHKKYPMAWLLDKILSSVCPDVKPSETPEGRIKWKKLESHESIWFRLPEGELDYPIGLENMRYQMHLYKAVDPADPEKEESGEEEGDDDEE